jgi:hypothetical protein
MRPIFDLLRKKILNLNSSVKETATKFWQFFDSKKTKSETLIYVSFRIATSIVLMLHP